MAKVIFLHLFVILFTGGGVSAPRGVVSQHALRQTPLGADIPPGADTPRKTDTPTPQEADSGIWSTSGQYASYWNAFLLHPFVILFTGGVSAPSGVWYPSMHWDRHPPGADTPQSRHPPRVDTPRSRQFPEQTPQSRHPPEADSPPGADPPLIALWPTSDLFFEFIIFTLPCPTSFCVKINFTTLRSWSVILLHFWPDLFSSG